MIPGYSLAFHLEVTSFSCAKKRLDPKWLKVLAGRLREPAYVAHVEPRRRSLAKRGLTFMLAVSETLQLRIKLTTT